MKIIDIQYSQHTVSTVNHLGGTRDAVTLLQYQQQHDDIADMVVSVGRVLSSCQFISYVLYKIYKLKNFTGRL